MIRLGLLLMALSAEPATDRPLASYGALSSFLALDCLEDWQQLCGPPAGPSLSFRVYGDRVEASQMDDVLVFRVAARTPRVLELVFDRCVPSRPECERPLKGERARLELRPGGRASWLGRGVGYLLGDAGTRWDRRRLELVDNAQYDALASELERRYVPGGKCEGLGGYEPLGGRLCINAPGRKSLAPVERERLAAREPGEDCDAVSTIRVMPFRKEAGLDRAYDGLVAGGCSLVPCLVERIVDTREMPDPRQAPIFAGFTVGDAALFMASELTGRSFEESLPTKVRSRIPEEGVYAYFRFVATRANREAIRADWRRWLAAHSECR
jgi:hypothetical protein